MFFNRVQQYGQKFKHNVGILSSHVKRGNEYLGKLSAFASHNAQYIPNQYQQQVFNTLKTAQDVGGKISAGLNAIQ